eukprot:scaffold2791_cov154-Amphora_coffeaeformis.AAC.12
MTITQKTTTFNIRNLMWKNTSADFLPRDTTHTQPVAPRRTNRTCSHSASMFLIFFMHRQGHGGTNPSIYPDSYKKHYDKILMAF